MNIVGKLIRAGTMQVSGELVTGILIEVPIETLRALPHLPMYSDVSVQSIPDKSEPEA